ncbi:pro-sigmaK processing inhibitor BofA family protein [Clostridium sp. Marseille-P3244]|uniref:pro-sigmaK processing inhibitor BofA family protein n=1 Tax=Clostridium sp. Marseille-P3244 TaxID=1871020 RepID=UPI003FA49AA2
MIDYNPGIKGAVNLGKKAAAAVVNFFIRAAVGMALIFFINQYVIPPDSSINVGLNAVSFLTSGSLGIPGVGLLYGIVCYQIL